jgi:hypothetical protein
VEEEDTEGGERDEKGEEGEGSYNGARGGGGADERREDAQVRQTPAFLNDTTQVGSSATETFLRRNKRK